MRFPGFTKVLRLDRSNLSHQVFLLAPRRALGEKEDGWECAGSKAERTLPKPRLGESRAAECQENIILHVLPLCAVPIPV